MTSEKFVQENLGQLCREALEISNGAFIKDDWAMRTLVDIIKAETGGAGALTLSLNTVRFAAVKAVASDDTLLGKLQDITTGPVVCRWSEQGRGWRLHETKRAGAVGDVREAITKFLEGIS